MPSYNTVHIRIRTRLIAFADRDFHDRNHIGKHYKRAFHTSGLRVSLPVIAVRVIKTCDIAH